MKLMTLLLHALLLLVCSTPSQADTMRCETGRVAANGDTTAEVLHKCGEPAQRQRRRECDHRQAGKPRRGVQGPFHVADCSMIDTWTYNFGPSRLVHRLIFKDDILDSVQTQGYGR